MPRRQRCHGFIGVMSAPSNSTRPPLGGNTPAIMLKSVVLPAPFGPMMPTISPASTEKSSRSMTLSPPKARDSEASSSIVRRALPAAFRTRSAVRDQLGLPAHRYIRRRCVVDDDEFQRPFLALAPLAGDAIGFRRVGERSLLEVDQPDDCGERVVAHRIAD